jgi:hypothetical protein
VVKGLAGVFIRLRRFTASVLRGFSSLLFGLSMILLVLGFIILKWVSAEEFENG